MRFRPPGSRVLTTLLVATLVCGYSRASLAANDAVDGTIDDAPIAPPRSGPIVPKPEPLNPRPFTLADRYLDAARRGDLEMLKRSLEKGADLHAKDGFGRSALLLATLNARSLEMVKFLKGGGLPIDKPDNRGRTPLGYAAGNGQLEMVDYLLEQGAAVDHKDDQGQTPLFHAVLIGSLETTARLLYARADVNVRDRFGDTPLMGACAKNFEEIARLLVEKGADPTLKDQEGRTARERATDERSRYCRELPSSKPGPL